MKKCKIISIKKIGTEMTYNVTMKSDQHNYKIVDKAGNGVYTANSHSVAYAFTSYQNAYLKCYYPIEFMCNVLTADLGEKEKIDEYIREVTRMGMVVKGVSINHSNKMFTIEDGKNKATGKQYSYIRCPFTSLDSLGDKAADSIIANQPFTSLQDFLHKVDLRQVSSRVFSNLVDAGAIDEIYPNKSKSEIKRDYEVIKDDIVKGRVFEKRHKDYVDQFGGDSLFDRVAPGEIEI